MTNPEPELQQVRAATFTRRSAMLADACELIEIALREDPETSRLTPSDEARKEAIFNRLRGDRLIHLVIWLADQCSDLIAALDDLTELSRESVLAEVHTAAAVEIDRFEKILKDSGYLQ